ncbi:hypothetical protein [Evansella vedderi]|uniref:hypothetical protein n=1 Tax=Evansella vedderi TaxID=38282 RepID=UPI0027D820E0|nr:hypothetical protein [Evansella vedderi]
MRRLILILTLTHDLNIFTLIITITDTSGTRELLIELKLKGSMGNSHASLE